MRGEEDNWVLMVNFKTSGWGLVGFVPYAFFPTLGCHRQGVQYRVFEGFVKITIFCFMRSHNRGLAGIMAPCQLYNETCSLKYSNTDLF